MRDFNEARREMRTVAAQETREQDLVLLEYAIEKDKAGEAEEKAKREEEKRVRRRISYYCSCSSCCDRGGMLAL